MPSIIPLKNTGDRKFSVILGVNEISIRTYYNPVYDVWVMDIKDSNGIMDYDGCNLVSGINLLERSPRWIRLFGSFRMTETASGINSLGDTAKLVWYTNEEYAEAFPPIDATLAPLTYDFDTLFTLNNVVIS